MKNTNIMSSTKEISSINNSNNIIKNFSEDNNTMKMPLINPTKKQENIFYTKLFLEKYREIIWTIKFYANHNEPIAEDKSLYTIIQSYPEIKSLISIFNLTMKQIKRKPKDGWLMYDILYFSYIDDKELCVSEIIYDEIGISESTYFRKKKLAIELISERLWNTSHQDVAAWQKFVKALDDKQHREEAS